MVELHELYVLLYAATAILASVVVWVAWRRRTARGARGLAVLMLGIAIWSVGAAVTWHVPTQEAQVFWLTTNALGIWMVPVGVLLAGLDVAKVDRWLVPGRIALIAIPAFALMNLEWLNPGGQYNMAFVGQPVGSYVHYEAVPGPLYWAFNVLAYAMVTLGLALILRTYLRSSGRERAQAAVMFSGGLLPFAADILTESRILPLAGLDLAPLSFLVTGALWLFAVLRGTLLDIVPVARNVLVDQMTDGVIVFDAEDCVVEANPAALALLDGCMDDLVGKSGEEVFSGMAGAHALLVGEGAQRAVLQSVVRGEPRHVELRLTPIVGPDKSPARLAVLRDVTEELRARESLQLARMVFDTVGEGIVVLTPPHPDQQIVDVNDAFCHLTGFSRDDLIGKDVGLIRSTEQSPEFYEALQRRLLATGEWSGEILHAKADGTVFPSWLSLSVVKDAEALVRNIVGVLTDLTEIRAAEKLTGSEILYRTLTELIPDLVFVVDGDMRVVTANPAAGRFLGRSVEELKGNPLTELLGVAGVTHKNRVAQAEGRLRKARVTNRPREYEEHLTFDGRERWLQTSVVSLGAVESGFVLVVSRDITDSKLLEGALRANAHEAEEIAMHDALTGVGNRRALMVGLDHAIALGRRGRSATMLFMDIDNFKRCNDERGHAFGDEVLTSVARLLQKEAREVDLVARLGGDEFAALLADTDEAEAEMVAKRLEAGVEALGAEIGIPIGMSVGVAAVEPEMSAVHVVSMADQRMYEVKTPRHQDREAAGTE